jgi:hypothetical protein
MTAAKKKPMRIMRDVMYDGPSGGSTIDKMKNELLAILSEKLGDMKKQPKTVNPSAKVAQSGTSFDNSHMHPKVAKGVKVVAQITSVSKSKNYQIPPNVT